MNQVRTFLDAENEVISWRFWLLFVVMTNIGFFSGLAIEWLIFGEVNVYIGTALSGVGQSWVLSRHFPERGQWAIASAVGWLVGGLLSQYVLSLVMPDISFAVNLFLFPIIAGAVMGIPLYWVLKQYLPNVGWWWILVSAIGPAVQFPGAIMGGVIFALVRQQTSSHAMQNE